MSPKASQPHGVPSPSENVNGTGIVIPNPSSNRDTVYMNLRTFAVLTRARKRT